jgi:hypothetical protein
MLEVKKIYVFLEDFFDKSKGTKLNLTMENKDFWISHGAKIITLEEWRDIQLNKIN